MHLHELFRDRQTEPHSLRFISARLVHLIELVEDLGGFLWRYARAGVRYGNLQPSPFDGMQPPCSLYLDEEYKSYRVADEVRQHLSHFVPVSPGHGTWPLVEPISKVICFSSAIGFKVSVTSRSSLMIEKLVGFNAALPASITDRSSRSLIRRSRRSVLSPDTDHIARLLGRQGSGHAIEQVIG